MANLKVQIVNGDPADVDALIAYLREEGHEAAWSEEVELREGAGVGEVIVQILGGVAAGMYIVAQVQTWIRDYYASRPDEPSGVRLLGPDGEPLDSKSAPGNSAS